MADRGQTADGRIWGNRLDDVLRQISEVECVAKLHEVYRPEFEYQGKFIVPEEKTCLVNRDFLRTFDISMPDGDIYDRLGSPGCVVISESLAGKFRGYGGDMSPELKSGGTAYHIAGIFKDIPETSHWRADVLALLPDSIDVFCYTYLLLRDGSDAESVQQKINAALDGMELEDFSDPQASLMPLTDIHLRSCNLRELDVNGNIVYIWLVTGANVLLLIVVLFNLWFNSTLIFSYNSGMYRLLRLHGAPVNVILRTEALQGLAMALAATAAGLLLTAYISGTGAVQGEMPPWAVCMVCMAFISVVVAVSVVPAAGGMSMTYFLDGQFSGTQLRFSYKNVHKINGATSCGIVGMLNSEFIRSIAVAFVAAAPASWLILHIWLRRFAYRISLDWWLFAGAGIVVLVVSLLSVSVQSWHAARANPADGIRK